jgi:ADP-ribose pyrophosphatase
MDLLMGTFNTPGFSDQHTSIFLATGLSPCPVDRRGAEEHFMTIEVISLDDVDSLIADGTLVDETTVLGLLLARAHLDS